MLSVRHSIGSRLLFQTESYDIHHTDGEWRIIFHVDKETSIVISTFQDELNIFEVKEETKTWYYSSDARVYFDIENNQMIIIADHSVEYPA